MICELGSFFILWPLTLAIFVHLSIKFFLIGCVNLVGLGVGLDHSDGNAVGGGGLGVGSREKKLHGEIVSFSPG